MTRDGGCGQLQSIVNYRGFRIIAVSVIPISKQTIIYGSHDGGKTVHADYEAFNVRLNRIFAGFNLKVRTLRAPHSVTEAVGLPERLPTTAAVATTCCHRHTWSRTACFKPAATSKGTGAR